MPSAPLRKRALSVC